jgi:hypothetical protein
MKKIKILILLTLPLFGSGQILNGVLKSGDEFTRQELDALLSYKHDTIPVGSLDTVKCEMLVYDNNFNNNSIAYVIKGYSVNKRIEFRNSPGSFCFNCENYWQRIMYLDEKKKPLAANISVWMSR